MKVNFIKICYHQINIVMGSVINFIKKNKEEKLRKWCIEQTLKANVPGREFLATVEWLYKWVSKGTI